MQSEGETEGLKWMRTGGTELKLGELLDNNRCRRRWVGRRNFKLPSGLTLAFKTCVSTTISKRATNVIAGSPST